MPEQEYSKIAIEIANRYIAQNLKIIERDAKLNRIIDSLFLLVGFLAGIILMGVILSSRV
jgi:hypothetical protein